MHQCFITAWRKRLAFAVGSQAHLERYALEPFVRRGPFLSRFIVAFGGFTKFGCSTSESSSVDTDRRLLTGD